MLHNTTASIARFSEYHAEYAVVRYIHQNRENQNQPLLLPTI